MDIHKLRIFAESWNVAYRKKQKGVPLDRLEEPFIVIRNSFRYWAADPFLFEKDGDTYIFAELYDYILARGVIGYLKLNADKPRWIPIIRERHHLSFPFIYEFNNEIFILPESIESKTLYQYRAVGFPDHWEKEEALLTNVRLVDTTPIKENDYKKALTYDIDDESLKYIDFSTKKIELLYSDPDGRKRPAGYINAKEGLRIAQKSEEDYGKGLILYQFDYSREQKYTESEMKIVSPQDVILSPKIYLDGMHTYNQSDHYEVIDIKTRRFNILNLGVRFFRKLRAFI